MEALLNAVETTSVTTNVLLKDENETTSVVINASKSLSLMETSRINWERGSYRTSNQELYTVLADCLAFCGELSISEAKQRSSALEQFYKERGYKYKRDLPLATRVVRAVFGEVDRRRISTYSLVIRQAQKESIGIQALSDWITKRGGVQEITLARSATYITPKTKAGIAREIADTKQPLGFAKSELLSFLADAEFIGESCVLLAEQQADGSFGIKAVLRNDGLVNAAYAALYTIQREKLEKAQAEIKAANDADGALAKSA